MQKPHGDRWGDRHVAYHFAGCFFIASVVAVYFGPQAGATAGGTVGAGRELWKQLHGFDCWSQSRIVADVSGAALGALFGMWLRGFL